MANAQAARQTHSQPAVPEPQPAREDLRPYVDEVRAENPRWRRPVAVYKDGSPDWYRIENAAKGSGPAMVYIYDEIGYVGVGAAAFASDLAAISSNSIELHLNSPGGDVFDGIAIYNCLKNHSATVTCVVDGVAASAASFIAQAADKIVMTPNAEMMIHDAFGLCVGNAGDLRSMADLLERTSNNIASIYAARAGGDVASWRTAMQAESWYSAQEAVDAGLADEVQGGKGTARAKAHWDFSVFNYASREAAPTPYIPADSARDDDEHPAINPASLVETLKGILQ